MNKVDLQRTRRRGAACAAVAAFALGGLHQASAEVANPNIVSADSAYIISVPDTAACWNAWEANGLYDSYKTIMAMPDVAEKIAGFKKELSIVESSLGFKLDGPTLSKVFASADIYMIPGDKPTGAAVMKVADTDKLTKLIDLAEKAAVQSAAKDDATTGTDSIDKNTSAIATTDYNGVTIKTFKSDDEDKKVIYARSGDYLFVAADVDSIKKTIDRSKAAAPEAGTVATSADFKKIDTALAAEKGEIYVYGNQEVAAQLNSQKDMPSSLSGPLKSLMNDLAPITYYGASIKIAPKEIFSYSYGILKEGTSDSLLIKNPGDKPLAVAAFVPETTMLAGATSLFNAKGLYDLATGAAESSDKKLDKQLEDAEKGLGFSIKNDLLPAMGNEVAFSLNSVSLAGLLPKVDATLIIGVKDKAKMQKVVDGIEAVATKKLAASSSDDESSASAFKKDEVSGVTVKSAEVSSLPGVVPSYALTDDYLFLGSTKSAVTDSLSAGKDGKGLSNGEMLKSLGHGISGNANVIQYANVSGILEVAKQVTGSIPAAMPMSKYIDSMKVLDATGSISRIENGAVVGRGVLKLK